MPNETATKLDASGLPRPGRDWALFLDIDGTLLDIAMTPDAVEVPRELPHALCAAGEALGGALALVSGRPVFWIDQRFSPFLLPAAGQHGAEIRREAGGPIEALVKPRDLVSLRQKLAAIAAATPGVLLEEKGYGVAVHYRAAPMISAVLRTRLEELMPELGEDFHLLPGKMVFEIKPQLAWKERAVELFMQLPAFTGRTPIFIGDDKTDEGAFVAVRRRGGIAIQVGPATSEAATGWVSGPSAVREWLFDLPHALGAAP